jgi:cysteine desulfurase/selenocysteine lyase
MKIAKKRPPARKPSAGEVKKASGRTKKPAGRGPKRRSSSPASVKNSLSVPLCEVVGRDTRVPIAAGGKKRYVNLDNAASTPAIRPVLDAIVSFAPWYSNVHRGTGFKSKLSSWAFDRSREGIYRFVRATPERRIVLFTRNTTESINHLAARFPFKPDDVVHHSNELPWRKAAHVVHVDVLPDGRVDEADLRARLEQYRGRVALVAVTGASNVTGYINPVHDYARWAHEAGSRIFVDAAQLAPHRPIDMKDPDDPEALDFIAFSAHKMYAPFGAGVLVGERSVFEKGDPSIVGGGAVDIVNLENAYWTDLPDREEAGTPDIVGAVALGAAIRWIEETGWEKIIGHEAGLTAYALEKLGRIPGISIYGDTDPANTANRLGVIPLNVGKLPHALVAAILGAEWAIGTRSGCFCAHPYVKCLLAVGESEARDMEKRILNRDRSIVPGAVRVSFGAYNTKEDVDVLCEALAAVASGRFLDGYELNKERGEYSFRGMTEDFGKFFKEIAD